LEDEVRAPTTQAVAAAEVFINLLDNDCLDSRLAISHDGEINFFFSGSSGLFQVFIDDDGALSFYSKSQDAELAGDDLRPDQFPFHELQKFLRHVGPR
jgi:hypothetical protein